MMKALQRFGGAMFTPVLLFPFAGIVVGISILFTNPTLMGSLASPTTIWFKLWMVVQEGAWTVFRNMPILFAVGLPIGLAKTAPARACLAVIVSYMTFNYYIAAILTTWGQDFGVDFSQPIGGVSGLTMIAGVKTLDTSIIGSIFIAGIITYLHNRFFDKRLPDYLGIFQGTAFVTIIGFIAMLPIAFLTALFWPKVQSGIESMQVFLSNAGVIGVWLYTFLERILIPTGLHHFVYGPFVFGPAAVEGGLQAYWLHHIPEFASSLQPLTDLFPQGGFMLFGNSKVFGAIGIAGAMIATAAPENKRKVAGLIIPAALTAVLVGITEPLEFTFLFIAPYLFGVHAVLAATMAAVMYMSGVVGNFGGGILEMAATNWLPMFGNHAMIMVKQLIIGFSFTAIYFFTFKYLIVRFDVKTPGRESDDEDIRLVSKKEYREKKQGVAAQTATDSRDEQALQILKALGGMDNIAEINNCATRLRISVKNPDLLLSDSVFRQAGAHGVVRNDEAIQIIIGLSVSQVRDRIENIMDTPMPTNAQALV
ncbi:alpha-glucoside-specific PTS transporter subunit IIBC [Vibrio salinus]|uniref:alpha-glucoside-specific PTS transporter subunit IIBC n=1 Tax=Vibrio salinus TaxID=2899784 RepID=UPI001E549DDC|nr:alpha-glucoside-specific PTS transporter subunit IIBC [Vibrio salinus]MCE0496161.1 alpha-glucoside-specific PTS transporter subunit IIBC [Vibrio salinus]